VQKALIGILHQIPPSSIKKWNKGLLLLILETPKITHGKY
jgi:hypothetical protein